MKIKRTRSEVANHLEIDGIDIRNIDEEEIKGIVMILFDELILKNKPSRSLNILLGCISPQYAELDIDHLETEIWEV